MTVLNGLKTSCVLPDKCLADGLDDSIGSVCISYFMRRKSSPVQVQEKLAFSAHHITATGSCFGQCLALVKRSKHVRGQ